MYTPAFAAGIRTHGERPSLLQVVAVNHATDRASVGPYSFVDVYGAAEVLSDLPRELVLKILAAPMSLRILVVPRFMSLSSRVRRRELTMSTPPSSMTF